MRDNFEFRVYVLSHNLSSIVYRLSSILYRLSSIVYRLSSTVKVFGHAHRVCKSNLLEGRKNTGDQVTNSLSLTFTWSKESRKFLD